MKKINKHLRIKRGGSGDGIGFFWLVLLAILIWTVHLITRPVKYADGSSELYSCINRGMEYYDSHSWLKGEKGTKGGNTKSIVTSKCKKDVDLFLDYSKF